MPAEQEFRQRMRNLAVSAMRVLIEEVMREELEKCLCAEWGEITRCREKDIAMAHTHEIW